MSESSLKKKRTKQQQSADEGHVWVWGDNSQGQLLDLPACDEVIGPRLVEKRLVVALLGGYDKLRRAPDDCVDASHGDGHWLVLSESGEVRGAGRALEGQLGVLQREAVAVPIPVPLNGVRVTSVACGGRHSGLITDIGLVFTFGCNSFSQLGHSPGVLVVSVPTVVGELWHVSVTQLSLGDHHSGAVTSTGRLFLWGCNTSGQCALPDDPPPPAAAPIGTAVVVGPNESVRMVACGSEHSVALLRSGELRQWGWSVCAPPALPAGSRAVWVAAGAGGTGAAALDSGSVLCWGGSERDAVTGAAASRLVRGVSRVLCGRRWTAAFTPGRAALPAQLQTVGTPLTPVLGASSAAFASLEQLEAALGGPTLPQLRPGAQSTRALLPLVAR